MSDRSTTIDVNEIKQKKTFGSYLPCPGACNEKSEQKKVNEKVHGWIVTQKKVCLFEGS